MMAKERVDSPDLATPKRTHAHPRNTNSRIFPLKNKRFKAQLTHRFHLFDRRAVRFFF